MAMHRSAHRNGARKTDSVHSPWSGTGPTLRLADQRIDAELQLNSTFGGAFIYQGIIFRGLDAQGLAPVLEALVAEVCALLWARDWWRFWLGRHHWISTETVRPRRQ